jgi:hypothetical protein
MDIQDLLKEATKDTLSEENLQKLQEAIETKAKSIAKKDYDLKLEAALAKQDAQYADKLEKFLEDIDNDHTEKMETLVEGLSQKHYDQLSKLITKYKSEYITECKQFKDTLVNKVDKFFDIVVEEQVPKKELQEAVENVRSKVVLERIARLIGVDKIQQNKLVKEGITEAKTEIDSLREENQKLKADRKKLLTEKVDGKRKEILAEKTQGLPKVKKEYINKVLGNKSIDFITENFEYTLALFDEEEDSSREILKEQATKKTKIISENVDRGEKEIIKEKKEATLTGTEQYLSGFNDTF